VPMLAALPGLAWKSVIQYTACLSVVFDEDTTMW
jgi:hypothetical protein